MTIRIPTYEARLGIPAAGPSARAAPGLGGESGLATFGQALAGVGADLAAIAERQRAARAQADVVGGKVALVKALGDLELAADQDADFRAAPDRYASQANDVRARLAEGIADPEARRRFAGDAGLLIATRHVAVKREAWRREIDAGRAGLTGLLRDFANRAADAGSTDERAEIEGQAYVEIDRSLAAGHLTAQEAEARRAAFDGQLDGVLAARLIAGNPRAAQAALADATAFPGLTPAQRQAMTAAAAAEIERRAREAKAAQAVAAAALSDRLRDHLASLRDSGAGVDGVSLEAVTALLGETAARRFAADEDLARRTHATVAALRWAPPGEAAQALEALRPPPGSDGYADAAAAYRQAVDVYLNQRKAFAADPAGFVAAMPGVRDVATSHAAQRRLGVPAGDEWTLPKAQAEDLVAQLLAMPGESKADALQQLAAQHGPEAWPLVYRDLVRAKLPAEYRVLATTDHPVARKALAEALAAPKAELERSIGVNAKPVRDAVTAALEPFHRSLALAPDGQQVGAQYHEAAIRLAYRYAALEEPEAAAQRAVNELLLDRYDMVEQDGGLMARAPKGEGVAAADHGAAVLRDLAAADLADPGGAPSLTPEQRKDAYLAVARRGVWVSNARDDGWLLLDELRQPVLRADGRPVAFRFAEMAAVVRVDDGIGQVVAP